MQNSKITKKQKPICSESTVLAIVNGDSLKEESMVEKIYETWVLSQKQKSEGFTTRVVNQ